MEKNMEKRFLAPAEVCESFVGVGQRKAALPFGKMLISAILEIGRASCRERV